MINLHSRAAPTLLSGNGPCNIDVASLMSSTSPLDKVLLILIKEVWAVVCPSVLTIINGLFLSYHKK